MSLWISAQDVRDFAEVDYTTGRYSDAALGSNIQAAQAFLERATSRQFEVQAATTKTFTSNGLAVVSIPDLTSATSVTLQGATLVADASYWLLPDVRNSGVYVAVQLRPFGSLRPGYLANPEWFDRGLDLPGGSTSSLPNDLAVTGTWGWASKPYDVLAGVKAYATWLAKRGDAVLAGAVQDPSGAVLDYSLVPIEMQAAITSYRRGSQAVAV